MPDPNQPNTAPGDEPDVSGDRTDADPDHGQRPVEQPPKSDDDEEKTG